MVRLCWQCYGVLQDPSTQVRYQLQGDANILAYFSIDERSGSIMLRRSVFPETGCSDDQTFNVSLLVFEVFINYYCIVKLLI